MEALTAPPLPALLPRGRGFLSSALSAFATGRRWLCQYRCRRLVFPGGGSSSSIAFFDLVSLAPNFYSFSSRSMSRRFKTSLPLDLSSETAAWKSEVMD